MDDFEELKRKKEYLELQNEVAKLERNQKINKAFNYLPYEALAKVTPQAK